MDQETQNQAQPQAPVEGANPTQPAGGMPQNQDKSDAMTYPIGSQAQQPAEEDHRSILDRILGIFDRGKKEKPQEQPSSTDQNPTNVPPPVQ